MFHAAIARNDKGDYARDAQADAHNEVGVSPVSVEGNLVTNHIEIRETLRVKPELVDQIDTKELTSFDIAILLICNPTFVDKLDMDRISEEDLCYVRNWCPELKEKLKRKAK